MIRFQRSKFIAILAFGCSSATAWGQLPSQKTSPINQINRAWGFGVSNGYHECPPPVKCQPANGQRKSFLDKFDPIGGTLYDKSSVVTPHFQHGMHAPAAAMPMTTLPASPQSSSPYSQFAAPAETPLPGSHYMPQTPPPLPQLVSPQPIQIDPSNLQPSSPNFPKDNASAPAPLSDPNVSLPAEPSNAVRNSPGSMLKSAPSEHSQQSSDLDLLSESDRTDQVPPSPPLRRRQPTDKPLGETPDSWSPPKANSIKPQSEPESDEDLNLLPTNNGLPPVTYDHGYRSGTPVTRDVFENYSQTIPPSNQQSYQQGYPQSNQRSQSHQQAYQQPKTGSRSLIARDYPVASNPYAAYQVQQGPSYITVQNPYTQYNSNRYR
jgi:hypothetical protein